MPALAEQIRAARRVSVPLVGIETPDQAATMETVIGSLNGKAEQCPLFCWDIVRGLRALNDVGQSTIDEIIPEKDMQAQSTMNPTEALSIAAQLKKSTLIFFLNADRFIDSESVSQAVWNLRDIFKQDFRMLVLLAPSLRLPACLEKDVVILEEQLPDDEALGLILDGLYEDAGIDKPKAEPKSELVSACRGLSAFAAEQSAAMSLSKTGVNKDELWERKRKMIEQTPGLSVVRTAETFSQIGGNGQAKKFGAALFQGSHPPACIVFVDEIEKALGGSSGPAADTSGVSQDALGVLLRSMEDENWTGQICVGPPGSGKSMYAKSLGVTHEVPTLAVDLGAAKGSLVGQSEQQVRSLVGVIKAVAGSAAYWVATCNRLDTLPPELRRRFRYGLWYFDLPDEGERKTIWELALKKFGLKPQALPDDTSWTGADIRSCVEISWRLGISLKEGSEFITPVAKSDPESIAKLRTLAEGRFLSASYPGVYRKEGPTKTTGRRKLAI